VRARVRLGSLGALLLALGLVSCTSSKEVKEIAENVLTLQSGTIRELRSRTGQGPYTTYDVPPEQMLAVLDVAARKAVGCDGSPVVAVFVSPRYGEVIAKEREPAKAADDGYTDPFRTAMIAVVRPVPGDPSKSLVEIQEIRRGPFHGGCVAWRRDMPGWIAQTLRSVPGTVPINR
jgi:hypothetical protein